MSLKSFWEKHSQLVAYISAIMTIVSFWGLNGKNILSEFLKIHPTLLFTCCYFIAWNVNVEICY